MKHILPTPFSALILLTRVNWLEIKDMQKKANIWSKEGKDESYQCFHCSFFTCWWGRDFTLESWGCGTHDTQDQSDELNGILLSGEERHCTTRVEEAPLCLGTEWISRGWVVVGNKRVKWLLVFISICDWPIWAILQAARELKPATQGKQTLCLIPGIRRLVWLREPV